MIISKSNNEVSSSADDIPRISNGGRDFYNNEFSTSKNLHEKRIDRPTKQHANSNPEYLHQVANGPALDHRLEIAPGTCMTVCKMRAASKKRRTFSNI